MYCEMLIKNLVLSLDYDNEYSFERMTNSQPDLNGNPFARRNNEQNIGSGRRK